MSRHLQLQHNQMCVKHFLCWVTLSGSLMYFLFESRTSTLRLWVGNYVLCCQHHLLSYQNLSTERKRCQKTNNRFKSTVSLDVELTGVVGTVTLVTYYSKLYNVFACLTFNIKEAFCWNFWYVLFPQLCFSKCVIALIQGTEQCDFFIYFYSIFSPLVWLLDCCIIQLMTEKCFASFVHN